MDSSNLSMPDPSGESGKGMPSPDTGRPDLQTELQAMQEVAKALDALATDSQRRVIQWAASRFGVVVSPSIDSTPARAGNLADGGILATPNDFEHFVDLYDGANPQSEADGALVAAYWLQQVQGIETFTSKAANDLLKEMGRGIGNIAETFSRLQKRNPALVRQVSKSGRTKQARKTYKLTTSGIGAVRGMSNRKES